MSEKENATDIVVPVCNRFACTRGLLEGIYRFTSSPFHLYVIDNDSTDETADLEKIYTRDITVVHNRKDAGWGGAVNQGVALGDSPNIAILHGGVEVSKGWLGNMVAFLDTHPRIGAVGPLSSDPGDWQYIDRVRDKVAPQIPQFHTDDVHERNSILQYHFPYAGILIDGTLSFACVVLKRRTVGRVGALKETLSCREAAKDYCQRLRKEGYVLGLALDAYVERRPVEINPLFAQVPEMRGVAARL
ncbi:MAG: glycosyltransferase [Acidobacteriota bacterium]|jgi:GT2 family glycosyltransferase|nr:glycosyltransferase [Acidobacteriota bacterium]